MNPRQSCLHRVPCVPPRPSPCLKSDNAAIGRCWRGSRIMRTVAAIAPCNDLLLRRPRQRVVLPQAYDTLILATCKPPEACAVDKIPGIATSAYGRLPSQVLVQQRLDERTMIDTTLNTAQNNLLVATGPGQSMLFHLHDAARCVLTGYRTRTQPISSHRVLALLRESLLHCGADDAILLHPCHTALQAKTTELSPPNFGNASTTLIDWSIIAPGSEALLLSRSLYCLETRRVA